MTDTVPQYLAGSHAAMSREEALAILDRLVEHLRNGTTDMAPEQVQIPISDYLDTEAWEREIQTVFHRIPLPVCTSAELANVGDFKALRVVGKTELVFVEDIAEMPETLLKMANDGDIVMTMGAGSIANVPAQLQQLTTKVSA